MTAPSGPGRYHARLADSINYGPKTDNDSFKWCQEKSYYGPHDKFVRKGDEVLFEGQRYRVVKEPCYDNLPIPVLYLKNVLSEKRVPISKITVLKHRKEATEKLHRCAYFV